jgi:hypothetical protein
MMNEILLIKHLLKLCDIANKCGILQLKNYKNESNEWLNNSMYSYCLDEILRDINFLDTAKYLKLNRNREELIIITGFELIFEHDNTIYDVAKILGSMMEQPKIFSELLINNLMNEKE